MKKVTYKSHEDIPANASKNEKLANSLTGIPILGTQLPKSLNKASSLSWTSKGGVNTLGNPPTFKQPHGFNLQQIALNSTADHVGSIPIWGAAPDLSQDNYFDEKIKLDKHVKKKQDQRSYLTKFKEEKTQFER
jgi:hypothetical protein